MILVTVPSPDTVLADFALSLCNLSVYSAMHNIKLRIQSPRSSILPQSRNMGVKELLSDPIYTHLLFLDSDMAFPADTLTRLLKHNKDVVGATYARRQPSDGSAVSKVPEDFYTLHDSEELIEVDELPTGCMLIKRKVIEAMDHPVFEFGWNPVDRHVIGEDLMFSRKAKANGHRFFVEPKLSQQIVHLGIAGFALRRDDPA